MKIITSIIILLSITLSLSQAQERIIIDNFSQPDQIENKLDYYGSGDANNDGIVNFTDYNLMSSGTSNDRTDIDGNGTPSTSADLSILNNYLNQSISHLPSHWNKLNSSEKINWFEKMIEIDKTDTLTITGDYRCMEYATAFDVNFHGFEGLNGINPENVPIRYTKNGRFNIPVYTLLTNLNQVPSHAINTVLIGNNPLNFNDWYFVEPQNDERVYPGDPNMLVNNSVQIIYKDKVFSPSEGSFLAWAILQWDLDSNGNPFFPSQITGTGPNPDPSVVLSNPNTDINPPNINITSPENITYTTPNVPLEVIVTENETFLGELYYRIDNGPFQYIPCVDDEVPIWPVNEVSINENLSLSDGDHTLYISSRDIAKPENIQTQTVNFTISTSSPDTTPPNVWDNVPSEWQNSNFNITLNAEDEGSGVDFIRYCTSSSSGCNPTTEYSSPISVSNEGIQYLRYYAQDNAGNPSNIISKTLRLDKTNPSASDNAPFDWQNSDFDVTLNSSDALSGIKSTRYYLGSSETGTPNTEYTSPISISQEGTQYLRYLAEDNADNISSTITKTLRLDKTSPSASDNAPSDWQNSNFDVTLNANDALSGIKSTKYYLGSSETGTPNTEYSSPISVSNEGIQYLRYLAEDNADNTSSTITKTLRLDKTDPEITASINQIGETTSAEVSINVTEINPSYARYSYNGSNWNYFTSDTTFTGELIEGENVLEIEAEDKATNYSQAQETLNYNPTGIEEPISEEVGIYPNPVGNILNFKGLERPKISIYDITGRSLERKAVEGNTLDISKYKPGIYILKIEDSIGKVHINMLVKN